MHFVCMFAHIQNYGFRLDDKFVTLEAKKKELPERSHW